MTPSRTTLTWQQSFFQDSVAELAQRTRPRLTARDVALVLTQAAVAVAGVTTALRLLG